MIPDIFIQFPGQGSQKVGMSKELLTGEESKIATRYFDIADRTLGFSLKELCLNGPIDTLTLTENAQPAILTTSIISYEINKHLFNPLVAAGHSLGEYSALVAAGALDFQDAVLLVHKRGKYMQSAVKPGDGKMVAILGLELSVIEGALKGLESEAQIANINSYGQVVVSGDKNGVDKFSQKLNGAKVVELPVSAPFHSTLMKPAAINLAQDLAKITINPVKFPVFSNYLAEPLTDPEKIRQSLIDQVCGKVKWVECVEKACRNFPVTAGVEFGFGNTLSGLWKRIIKEKNSYSVYDLVSGERASDKIKEGIKKAGKDKGGAQIDEKFLM